MVGVAKVDRKGTTTVVIGGGNFGASDFGRIGWRDAGGCGATARTTASAGRTATGRMSMGAIATGSIATDSIAIGSIAIGCIAMSAIAMSDIATGDTKIVAAVGVGMGMAP